MEKFSILFYTNASLFFFELNKHVFIKFNFLKYKVKNIKQTNLAKKKFNQNCLKKKTVIKFKKNITVLNTGISRC